MSYRLSSKRRQTRKNFWLKAFGVIFIIIIIAGLFSILNKPFTDSTDSALEVGDQGVSFIQALLSNKDELIAENEQLIRERDEQTLDRQLQLQLVERNQELKRLLGRDIDSGYILAGVVKKPPYSPYDIYTLDAGSMEGVSRGDLVAFSDFVALGTISSVTETGSKALLFSAPGNTTEVSVNGETFTALGKGGGVLQISAARDAGIQPGDQLILPGYDLISIGFVQEVLSDPQDGFARVMAVTAVNVQAVDLVRVEEYRSGAQAVTQEQDGA